jgi:hypothetical protein
MDDHPIKAGPRCTTLISNQQHANKFTLIDGPELRAYFIACAPHTLHSGSWVCSIGQRYQITSFSGAPIHNNSTLYRLLHICCYGRSSTVVVAPTTSTRMTDTQMEDPPMTNPDFRETLQEDIMFNRSLQRVSLPLKDGVCFCPGKVAFTGGSS